MNRRSIYRRSLDLSWRGQLLDLIKSLESALKEFPDAQYEATEDDGCVTVEIRSIETDAEFSKRCKEEARLKRLAEDRLKKIEKNKQDKEYAEFKRLSKKFGVPGIKL